MKAAHKQIFWQNVQKVTVHFDGKVAGDAAAQIVRDAILPAIPNYKLGRPGRSNGADMQPAIPAPAARQLCTYPWPVA